MSTAVAAALARAAAENRAALVGYLPVGYPSVPESLEALRALVAGGCDIVEVGIPYSDPVMDGPTIQRATEVAVANGVGLRDALAGVAAVVEAGGAAVTMGYWNQVERMGVATFADELLAAGGSGAITPDLIPDEAGEWITASDERGLDRVFLVAPSSTDARIASTTAASRGFVYVSAVMGVTGARSSVDVAARTLVERVRALGPGVPACVGLGVSTGEQAHEIAAYADGVIVGSALVQRLLDGRGPDGVHDLAAELAAGVRR